MKIHCKNCTNTEQYTQGKQGKLYKTLIPQKVDMASQQIVCQARDRNVLPVSTGGHSHEAYRFTFPSKWFPGLTGPRETTHVRLLVSWEQSERLVITEKYSKKHWRTLQFLS